MTFEQQIRWVYKPILFVACLLPLAHVLAGVFGVGGVSLGANPIDKIQDTLGKWGLNFLLITLCVTPLRQLTELNALVRLRRMLGLFAFTYVTLHFANWLILDQTLDLSAIVEDIGKRPYITIGFVGFLMLIPLAVTSTNRMMRKLGRRWQKLHRLVYVVAILGIWHFYWQVKKDIREPLIYAGVLTLLLGFRLWRHWRRQSVAPRVAPVQPTQSLPG
ncbi:MAG TPA: protein-methionine-sulfoxide reductase heme-binding subunit MsrQ [Steroidobacteraceae bacterium]|nr:protein-methionine-sulfoxide reductase heme-binding subunit MsrQ [Steroidobacteraceae bacterium]